jgi:hypothetical protein
MTGMSAESENMNMRSEPEKDMLVAFQINGNKNGIPKSGPQRKASHRMSKQ